MDLKSINSTVLDLYVDPAGERELEEHFQQEQVNFTWVAKSFKDQTLELQLQFDHAE